MPSDGKSSYCLRQGELKSGGVLVVGCSDLLPSDLCLHDTGENCM
jgi:hypothetical protein